MAYHGRISPSEHPVQLYQEFLEHVTQHYSEQSWFALLREVARYVYHHKQPTREELIAQPADVTSVVPLEAGANSSRTDLSVRRRGGHPSGAAANATTLRGKRAAVVSFSPYPGDPRPRRAAEALANEGMNVEVICLAETVSSPRRETFKGVEILRIPLKHHRGTVLEYFLRYAVFIMMAFAVLGARSLIRRYDLVHVHNMPDVLVLTSLIPKAFGAKVILDLHDPMPELMMTIFNLQRDSMLVQVMARLEKWSVAIADVVITVNRACQKLFISRGCPAEKIRVVMNSPDESIFKFCPPRSESRPPDETKRPFVIMYHGTLVERNGLDLAVEALARVRESIPRAELRIYGHPTAFLERVMSSAAKKGLHEAVHYLGPRQLEQLVQAIEECDVGIIPNNRSIFTEINTPTRIFEYLALGKPVIAPRAPGIQDYFGDESLVSFELGNAEDLALKLAHVFSHPDKALEVVKRGQQVYLAHTWQEERTKLVNVAAELLSTDHRMD